MPAKGKLLKLLTYAVIAVVALVWVLRFDIKAARDDAPPQPETEAASLISVQFSESRALPYTKTLEIQGQVEPNYSVDLRAEVAARVLSLPVSKGDQVAEGDLLLQLDQDARKAQLAQAEADLHYKQQDLSANQRLVDAGGSTRSDVLRLASEVADAKLVLEEARLGLSRTRPVAPFSGVVDRLDVDPGDYLSIGDSWGRLVDISTLKVRAWVAQQDVAELALGQKVRVRLLDGSLLEGELNFIAFSADEETRSYQIEAIVQNPDARRIAGASASMTIDTGEVQAHRLSAALLTLDDHNQVGVRVLDADNRVHFRPVKLLSGEMTQAWVSGLEEEERLITLGAGFAEEGQQVNPVPLEESVEQGSR
ncbi:efflux RND transporter periplasmic adaptor subunit [Marinobacterium lutimaris]|uniref:Membrane fusion protein, multidrug efflux system n=1 Tax=Marinobacterium lutimaris TaxID=568106 RepID=A0A1H6DHN1_9GAMM|nr:efflux RND transporter periplasmic adaptor subunit [Marinobacterium lutimaris]SEG84662.1 membrane fusion protein, multidrug efflux system [Marinobacterium lutimaris]